MKRLQKSFMLNNNDISKLNKAFNRVDNTRTGKVTLKDIFKGYEIKSWQIMGEALAALVDIELDEDEPECIDFPDFAAMILTLCCFEPPEMIRFLMFCYDPEKNGYIEVDDLKQLMNNIHGIIPPETVMEMRRPPGPSLSSLPMVGLNMRIWWKLMVKHLLY